MESVVRAVAKHDRQIFVGPLVDVVPQFVVDRREVLARLVDAHLDAQVGFHIDVPGTGVADHITVARTLEERSLPEGLWQRLETQRRIEALAGSHHLLCAEASPLDDVGQGEARVRTRRRHERIDVGPVLRPNVTEEVGRERTVRRDEVAVFRVQRTHATGGRAVAPDPTTDPAPS